MNSRNMKIVKLLCTLFIILCWSVAGALGFPLRFLAILAAVTAGFSIGCALTYITYYHDAPSRSRALRLAFYSIVVTVLLGLVGSWIYNRPYQAGGWPLLAYLVPLLAIAWPREVISSPRLVSADDWPTQFFDDEHR